MFVVSAVCDHCGTELVLPALSTHAKLALALAVAVAGLITLGSIADHLPWIGPRLRYAFPIAIRLPRFPTLALVTLAMLGQGYLNFGSVERGRSYPMPAEFGLNGSFYAPASSRPEVCDTLTVERLPTRYRTLLLLCS